MGNSCSRIDKLDEKNNSREKASPVLAPAPKEQETNIRHAQDMPDKQVVNPLVPPSVAVKNIPRRRDQNSPKNPPRKDLPFIEKDNAGQIMMEATQAESLSSEGTSLDTCDATLEIWADEQRSSTTLHGFHGNTAWLFGEAKPSIIPIEDLLPQAIQAKHMLWIKTLLLDKKNARGNWHSLSLMLSRPVLIYNPLLKCKEKISVKMEFKTIDSLAGKAIFSVKLTRLDSASPAADPLALSSSGNKMTLFSNLLKADALDASKQTPKKRTMINVKVMPDIFSPAVNEPSQNELGFAKSVLGEASDGMCLPAHCRGKRLCYAVLNEQGHRIFLSRNYFKMGDAIFWEESDFVNCASQQGKIKKLVNIETKNISFMVIHELNYLHFLNEFKVAIYQRSEANFFEHIADEIPCSAMELIGRNDVVFNMSHAATFLLDAQSFEKQCSEIPLNIATKAKENFTFYDMGLNDFVDNPRMVSEAALKNLPLSILRLLISLHDGKLSKARKKYVYNGFQLKDILLNLSADKIELQLRDLENCREMGSRYSSTQDNEQTFLSPELLYFLSKNKVAVNLDLISRVKGFVDAIDPVNLPFFENYFFYDAGSEAFTVGLVLASVINKIFTAPDLQAYKEDMLKITSLLLSYNISARASLLTVLAAYRYLYEVSENSSQEQKYKITYGNLTAALIKLADFYPEQPNFYEFHVYVQKELRVAVPGDRRMDIDCVTKLINLFDYMKVSLAPLNKMEIDKIVNVFKWEISTITNLTLLSDYQFSPPTRPIRFSETFKIIADIIFAYDAARKLISTSLFFNKSGSELIVDTIDKYKENLCDLTAEALDNVMIEAGMKKSAALCADSSSAPHFLPST
ncbi:MAG: hypothetical protein NTZ67_07125 [Gammaproteobacteria bacterium]|nr:hypothetical protein [Gammaproteobacteria bacterium]